MFKLRLNNSGERETTLPGRVLWRGAWALQIVLWGLLAWVVIHYWTVEVPTINSYHENGLVAGFDGLAGVVASVEPGWENVREITGQSGGARFSRLQGDVVFKVWRELDEMQSWNAGMARLQYSREGKLLWARRYLSPSPSGQVQDASSPTPVPVVFSWSDGRSNPAGSR